MSLQNKQNDVTMTIEWTTPVSASASLYIHFNFPPSLSLAPTPSALYAGVGNQNKKKGFA